MEYSSCELYEVKIQLQTIATLDNVPRTASDIAISALIAFQARTMFSGSSARAIMATGGGESNLETHGNNNNRNETDEKFSSSDLVLALQEFTRNAFVENLKSCSLLELLLCVAAYRLHFTRDRFHFTIAALTQELREMGSVEQLGAAKDATDGVVARSFETLLRMKLVRIGKERHQCVCCEPLLINVNFLTLQKQTSLFLNSVLPLLPPTRIRNHFRDFLFRAPIKI